MTKSAIALVRASLAVARRSLDRYSSPSSRRDLTQHRLFAIPVLRRFLKTDFRGVAAPLEERSDLRKALTLRRVPHDSTLCYAQPRILKKGGSKPSCGGPSTLLANSA